MEDLYCPVTWTIKSLRLSNLNHVTSEIGTSIGPQISEERCDCNLIGDALAERSEKGQS